MYNLINSLNFRMSNCMELCKASIVRLRKLSSAWLGYTYLDRSHRIQLQNIEIKVY